MTYCKSNTLAASDSSRWCHCQKGPSESPEQALVGLGNKLWRCLDTCAPSIRVLSLCVHASCFTLEQRPAFPTQNFHLWSNSVSERQLTDLILFLLSAGSVSCWFLIASQVSANIL